MDKLELKDLNLEGQKVLMRVDFNVPLNASGAITDDERIRAAIPSINYILNHGASLILMSHLGEPKGKDLHLSLAPVAKKLSSLLGKKVQMASDVLGEEVEKSITSLKKGDILLLENLRFYEAEKKPEKDPSFAKKLASYGTVYVNDAFGTAHRKHSSTYTIATYFPDKAAMGFLMQKEVKALMQLVTNPKRPYFAIMGGSKVSSKVGVIKELLHKVDKLFIGGGMVYTFLKAQNIPIGSSIFEEEMIGTALEILQSSKDKIVFPADIVIGDQFSDSANRRTVDLKQGIPEGWQGMDIGEKTLSLWEEELEKANSIFWNGPLGVFEFPNFAIGTNQLARFLGKLQSLRVVGGGDSLAAINALGIGQQFSHLSTGGGASLEFLELNHLPAIDILSDKK
jgi:phosphoglycerate kinase